jgi:hypothetical protein
MKQKWSEWGSIEGYKTKAGALSSIRSVKRRMSVDRIKHPIWTNPRYKMIIVKNPDKVGFIVRYKYPILKKR